MNNNSQIKMGPRESDGSTSTWAGPGQAMKQQTSNLQICIRGVDGGLATFTQDDPAMVQRIVQDCLRPDFFKQERIAIAGQYSVTTLVLSRVARIDLLGDGPWSRDPRCGVGTGISDIEELRKHQFFDQVEALDLKHLERPRVRFTAGKPAAAFVEIQLLGSQYVYLKLQIIDVPYPERLQRIRSFLALPSVSFRLAHGGLGIANLTNAVQFTGYPGPVQVPADAWSANEADA